MRLCETMPDMNKSVTLRQLAGTLVRDEIARQHLNQIKVAAMAHMGRSTLSKIIAGSSDKITPTMLRSVEGALGMPRHLLTAVMDGDVAKIEGMEFADADLKRHVVASMREVTPKPPKQSRSRHSA